jgi:hypothetical protein
MKRIPYKPAAALLCAALLAAPVGAQSPAIAPLDNNEWVELTPQDSQRYYPQGYSCPGNLVTSANPVGRAFSGMSYGEGRLFLFGGGHGSHPGNDVEIYDITANKWFQQYTPECCNDVPNGDACQAINGGSGSPILSPEGRPLVEHTYQYMAWDPARDRLVGRLWPGTWAFDPSSQGWTALAGPYAGDTFSPSYWAANSLLLYDSTLDRFVNFGRFGSNDSTRKIFSFNPQTNEWTELMELPDAFFFEAVGAYDPDTRRHVIVSKNHPGNEKRFWKYDLAANNITDITAGVPGALRGGDKLGLAYDTRNDVLVVLQSVGQTVDVWIHDLAENSWTPLPRPSPAPSGAANMAKWGTFVYDPGTNAFFFIVFKNGSGGTGGDPSKTHLWAYRYRVNDDPIDPVDVPQPPTGVSVQ